MKPVILTDGPLLEQALALETLVWEALVAGDPEADGRMLSEDFLGVYPSGFSGRDGHCGQLSSGPVMESFQLSGARLRVLSETAMLLSYHARYLPRRDQGWSEMLISSLWEKQGDHWVNTFSQDTPQVSPKAPVP